MSNQLVVSFAAAAMAAIPAQAAVNPEQGHKVAAAAFGTLSDARSAPPATSTAMGGQTSSPATQAGRW